MTKPSALALVDVLQAAHAELRSWRKVQKVYFPGVHFTSLNRIALSGGEWLPKDKQVLTALGLKKPRRERTQMQIKICEMVTETKEQVLKKWKRKQR